MYYPQQSPGMSQKLPAHHDQSNPWNRQHLVTPQSQPPPTSPGYTMYTNGAIMQHPHMPPMQHHHHQNSLGHYPSPPSQLQQSPAAQPISPHWQSQLMKYESVRAARSPHHRARASAMASRGATKSAITITNPNKALEEEQPPSPSLALAMAINHPSSTVAPAADAAMRPAAPRPPENTWTQLDMGGVNIKSIPPNSGLFSFTFLTCLYLNHNSLTSVPPEISKLRHLDLLDLSGNNLSSLPVEIGMVTSLRELYLFDNHLTYYPTLGIEGNPMDAQLKALLQKDGTQAVISHLRDQGPMPIGPPPRPFMSYNILCERAATAKMYGYTPSWALAWDYRKARVMQEVTEGNADVVCLQEDFFTRQMGDLGYEGVFGAKSRYKTMQDSDRRQVDGSATFFKKDRFQLVESHLVEFNSIAMQRQDFKKTDDMFNRVLGKDHIAVVCLLEDLVSGSRIIVSNTHLHWDAAYADVKLVQTALLMEEIEKIANGFAKYPPRPPDAPSATDQEMPVPRPPPPTYSDGTKIPMLICGDYNSIPSSGVLSASHPDFLRHTYGNYTSEGLRHRLGLKSAYSTVTAGGVPDEIMSMTNVTPGFRGILDYVWYTAANLILDSVVGDIDKSYLDKVVGFPNPHFPSDLKPRPPPANS
ncbi:glucose-repressible alcohol dehydrogenase transcriptional effector [Roridomyces roridus]|uniref:CCR4-Not complex 3'-5'-exoribonuclease subunit Ccr4 n=1 Tax=Roridomyces roridus TaxID=1738132 RepID=A0AAD7FZS5_9AGAR|nr:glucose-repressible alcohol dehydrogenase transcriptional effector [Roridomyces roridus]